jgi:PhnB protein
MSINKALVQPYLFFDGRADEAVEFYRQAVGAEVEFLLRFKDSPEPAQCPPGSGEKVMHATLSIGQSKLMLSDGHCASQAQFKGFALSLTVPTVAEAERLFAALVVGGQVVMPQTKTFFSPSFGMVTDRFGVLWQVYVAP